VIAVLLCAVIVYAGLMVLANAFGQIAKELRNVAAAMTITSPRDEIAEIRERRAL
jgi:hypothetical protein